MRLQVSTGLQGHLSLLYNLQVKMISTFQNPYGTEMSMVDKLQFQILNIAILLLPLLQPLLRHCYASEVED